MTAVRPDAESHRVRGILEGARRGVRDPDVELFEMLTSFESSGQENATVYLVKLMRDADQH